MGEAPQIDMVNILLSFEVNSCNEDWDFYETALLNNLDLQKILSQMYGYTDLTLCYV